MKRLVCAVVLVSLVPAYGWATAASASPAKRRPLPPPVQVRQEPQAVTLAESRGIRCAEVDLALLRGEREPDLTLFTA